MKLIQKIAIVLMIVGLSMTIFSSIMLIKSLHQAQKGDLNLDGKIDILDLSLMAENFQEVKDIK